MIPVFFQTHQFITGCGFSAISCLYRYSHSPSYKDDLYCKYMYLLHVIIIQWNLHIPDTIVTQAECPDYRGVLISEVKVKCYVFIQIKALYYNLITLFFIKAYESMTKLYKFQLKYS